MKIQRTPLILLFSAAFVAGGVAILEANKTATESARQADQVSRQKVFGFEESQITFLTIERADIPPKSEANANPAPNSPASSSNPTPEAFQNKSSSDQVQDAQGETAEKPKAISLELVDGKWQLSAPVKVPASEASVAFLTNLLTTDQRQQTLSVKRDRLPEFGLSKPTATIEITLKDKQRHKLILGNPTFDRTFLYALIDPDKGASEVSVSLVSLQFANAVDRELQEWQAVPVNVDENARGAEANEPALPDAQDDAANQQESPSSAPNANASPAEVIEVPAAVKEEDIKSENPDVEASPSSVESPVDKPSSEASKAASQEIAPENVQELTP